MRHDRTATLVTFVLTLAVGTAVPAQDWPGATTYDRKKEEAPPAGEPPVLKDPGMGGGPHGDPGANPHSHGAGEAHGHAGPELPPGHPPMGGAGPAVPAGSTSAEPAAAAPATTPGEGGTQKVELNDLTFNIPSTWKSLPPSSKMRAAEIEIAAAAGDPEPGNIAVFYFGPSAGGVEANIERWYGQMEIPSGKPAAEAAMRETFTANGLEVTFIDLSGHLAASTMPGMGASGKKENYRMLAAIVMAPSGPWFFKGTGPEKTMAEGRDAFVAFLKSMAPRTP